MSARKSYCWLCFYQNLKEKKAFPWNEMNNIVSKPWHWRQAQCLISIPFTFTVSVSFLLRDSVSCLCQGHLPWLICPLISYILLRSWLTSLAPVSVDTWRPLCNLKMAAASSRKWFKVLDSFSALETQSQWHHQRKDTGISVLECITSFSTCYMIIYPGYWVWRQE